MVSFVTGSTGFIGGRLVDALVERGDDVRVLVRANSPAPRRGLRVKAIAVDYMRADLGVAPDTFRGADRVFHVAGLTRALARAEFDAANVTPTEHLLAAIVASGAMPRLVHVSSQAAGGPAPSLTRAIREDDAPAPFEPYGDSKLAGEQAAGRMMDRLPVTVIRPPAVYGGGDAGFLTIFKTAKNGIALYPAIADQTISIVAVEDLVRALIVASEHSAAIGRTYYIAHETTVTWREIYRAAGNAAGWNRAWRIEADIPRWVVGSAARVGDVVAGITGRPGIVTTNKIALAAPRFWICDPSRARRELGFVADLDLERGMTLAYDWYMQRQWI